MARRRGWREPILAFTGVALAIGAAGIGILVVDRVRQDDNLIVYSSGPSGSASRTVTEGSGSPTPETHTATPDGSGTQTVEATATTPAPTKAVTQATATRTPTPARTATPGRTATPARTSTPTATPTSITGLRLAQTSYVLPGDATANGGSTIGPFCCQGRTVTLRSAAGEIVGYAYWYKWVGQAYNLPTASGGTAGALPDIQVLIQDTTAGESAILFSVAEALAGTSKTAEVGRLRFTVTITSAESTSYNGADYVWESSLAATMSVQAR